MKKSTMSIASNLTIPLADFVTSTQVILAQRGKGKSYTMAVEAEELLAAKQQVVVIDPTGAHWGLRSSADGKRDGYPIAVFGGEHADVPLDTSAGELVANAIASEHFSAIIDLSLFRKGETLRFMAAFLETLYRKNRDALHLFIDEADVVAPQKAFGPEQARVLGASEDIVRRGRIRGIGCTMITQRPQVLNKDVLTQAEMLTTLGMNHPKDVGAIEAWIAVHGDQEKAKTMIESLPSLPRGDAWVWNPSSDIFKRITVRERRTYDSGRTPKAGERIKAAKVLARVDIEKLGAAIAEQVTRAKEDDPKALRAEIARLKLEQTRLIEQANNAAQREDAARAKAKPVKVIDPKKLAKIIAAADKVSERFYIESLAFKAEAANLASLIRTQNATMPAAGGGWFGETKAMARRMASRDTDNGTAYHVKARMASDPEHYINKAVIHRDPKPEKSSSVGDNSDLKLAGGTLKIMTALAQYPEGLTDRRIGIIADVSTKGGTYATYLSRLKNAGYIEKRGDLRVITTLGIQVLGPVPELPTGSALAAYWFRELGNGGESKILRVLVEAGFLTQVSYEAIGVRANISIKGGTFSTYVSRLKSRGLVSVPQRGYLQASPELFDV